MRNASAAMQRNDRTEPVAAFEWLVGCNGGLGGWQDRAFVVVPRTLPFPAEPVVGTDALHVALRTILRHLGHRAHVRDEESGRRDPCGPACHGHGDAPMIDEAPPFETGRVRPPVSSAATHSVAAEDAD